MTVLGTIAVGASVACSGNVAATSHAATPRHRVILRPARTDPPAPPRSCQARPLSRPETQQVLDMAAARIAATARALTPDEFPSITNRAGDWLTTTQASWTSGFFPGSLWLVYAHTRRPLFERAAAAWTANLTAQASVTSSHDVGFEILSSFGNGYRLTASPSYREVMLDAAASLASRYSPIVGAIRSWGPQTDNTDFQVIVDGLMNAELLFWAAKHGGPGDLAKIAWRHDLTTLAHVLRRDGSVVHLVDFNPLTGAVTRLGNPQGYDLHSTWARGQAWAIAGFTIAFRETGDQRFLAAARATAGYFIRHLPSDCVPYWDFQAPGIPYAPKDSSAAAIAAAYLLQLSTLDPNRSRDVTYRRAAASMIAALTRNDRLSQGQAILGHGAADEPVGQYGIGTAYGDYYFITALERYLQSSSMPAQG